MQKPSNNAFSNLSPVSTMEDRISALPDEVIHHIFSFMDLPDVVHTSILSTRWKHSWLSTPSLNFTYHSPNNSQYVEEQLVYCSHPLITCNNCQGSRINRINFADNFLDRVFIARSESTLIKFQMCNFRNDLDQMNFLSWVIDELSPQETILYFTFDDYSHLPANPFDQDIRVLELKYIGNSEYLPNSFSCATSLKILDLSNVRFQDDDDYYADEFVLNCLVLETLKLRDCDLTDFAVLTVSTPLLKSLELHSLYIRGNMYYSRYKLEDGNCKVKTIAPNLRSLHVTIAATEHYSTRTSVDVCVEGVVSLASASVSIGVITGDEYVTEHCAKPLIEALTGIPLVEALKVSDHLIQVITAIPASLERLPKLFHNLKSLMLMDEDICYLGEKVLKVKEVLIFLERLPHIETLVWERRHKNCCLYEDEDLVATMPSQSIFSCLKSIEYRNFIGIGAEQKFVEFLLGRAPVLREMIIKTQRLSSLSGGLTPFKKKLLSLPRYGDKLLSLTRASSMVTISYQLRS